MITSSDNLERMETTEKAAVLNQSVGSWVTLHYRDKSASNGKDGCTGMLQEADPNFTVLTLGNGDPFIVCTDKVTAV